MPDTPSESNPEKKADPDLAAKSHLLNEYHGVLSTHSADMPGFPFGSTAYYCLDNEGHAIILISNIAQHTKNILADNKVSLIVTETDIDDIHTEARLTILVEVEKQDDSEGDIMQRYYRFFPPSRQYHLQNNFDFYHLNTVKARYIGGFEMIHWISSENL